MGRWRRSSRLRPIRCRCGLAMSRRNRTTGPAALRADQPYFQPPIVFVIPPPEGSEEPFHQHNHQPDIAWLPNGDLMAIWYTTRREQGTELTVLASRLRAGCNEWEPASEFFKAPTGTCTATASFTMGKARLHHMNGMGPEGGDRLGAAGPVAPDQPRQRRDLVGRPTGVVRCGLPAAASGHRRA
jgi:hypothetical protein